MAALTSLGQVNSTLSRDTYYLKAFMFTHKSPAPLPAPAVLAPFTVTSRPRGVRRFRDVASGEPSWKTSQLGGKLQRKSGPSFSYIGGFSDVFVNTL
ncbi:hypothetical protein J6590_044250 [Homalodisca vitripennis]|nr:hypothetical protein J6590_044250 [Homalodisca vitripennis]